MHVAVIAGAHLPAGTMAITYSGHCESFLGRTSPALRERLTDLPLKRKAGDGRGTLRLSARIPDSEVLSPALVRDRALDAKSSKYRLMQCIVQCTAIGIKALVPAT